MEELAGTIWRKPRLRLAEAATYHAGLRDVCGGWKGQETVAHALVHLRADKAATDGSLEAIRASQEDTASELLDLEEQETKTDKALRILRGGKAAALERAISVLGEDIRDWWQDALDEPCEDGGYVDDEEGAPYTPDAIGLSRFLEDEVLPWYERRRAELANRPIIQRQAYGEAFSSVKLEALARYETHLDRKLERTLAMLIRLRELRLATARESVSQNGTPASPSQPGDSPDAGG